MRLDVWTPSSFVIVMKGSTLMIDDGTCIILDTGRCMLISEIGTLLCIKKNQDTKEFTQKTSRN